MLSTNRNLAAIDSSGTVDNNISNLEVNHSVLLFMLFRFPIDKAWRVIGDVY